MQMSSPSGTAYQYESQTQLKLFYINVSQTIAMWTGENAQQHQTTFARTVEMVMMGSQADILWLCEAGCASNGLSESELTPKQVLEGTAMLNNIADIFDDLGPYLVLVRKNTGIEHIDVPELHTFPVSGSDAFQKFVLSRFRIGQSTLVGVVAHVLQGRKAALKNIVNCIKNKGWYHKATVVMGGNFNVHGDVLTKMMQSYQPVDGVAASDEVWRVHESLMALKGDCFAYKGVSDVQDLNIYIGHTYKDNGWHGCLETHDVVAARVTLATFQHEDAGVVAQHIGSAVVDEDVKNDGLQLSAWEQHLLNKVDTFVDHFWKMMDDDAMPLHLTAREKALKKLWSFIFAKVRDDDSTDPRLRSRVEVMRSVKELLDRRAWYDSSYAYESEQLPRILTQQEMQNIMRHWKEEYESTEEQQQMIDRDKEMYYKRSRKEPNLQSRRHGRFCLHIRRTYGNAGVCKCIIQTGRFDEVLLQAIMEALPQEEPNEDEAAAHEKKVRHIRAAHAHRRGRYVTRLVNKDPHAWWKLSHHERQLYYAYKDGTLIKERNESSRACGSGSLFSQEDEETAQVTLERCFTYRTIEQALHIAYS